MNEHVVYKNVLMIIKMYNLILVQKVIIIISQILIKNIVIINVKENKYVKKMIFYVLDNNVQRNNVYKIYKIINIVI